MHGRNSWSWRASADEEARANWEWPDQGQVGKRLFGKSLWTKQPRPAAANPARSFSHASPLGFRDSRHPSSFEVSSVYACRNPSSFLSNHNDCHSMADAPPTQERSFLRRLAMATQPILTRIAHGSAPFITTFALIHLSAPILANLGGTSLASQAMVRLSFFIFVWKAFL